MSVSGALRNAESRRNGSGRGAYRRGSGGCWGNRELNLDGDRAGASIRRARIPSVWYIAGLLWHESGDPAIWIRQTNAGSLSSGDGATFVQGACSPRKNHSPDALRHNGPHPTVGGRLPRCGMHLMAQLRPGSPPPVRALARGRTLPRLHACLVADSDSTWAGDIWAFHAAIMAAMGQPHQKAFITTKITDLISP
jgi:hypothetical protein